MTAERLAAIQIQAEDAISNIDYPGSDSPEWEHKAKARVSELCAIGVQAIAERDALRARIETALSDEAILRAAKAVYFEDNGHAPRIDEMTGDAKDEWIAIYLEPTRIAVRTALAGDQPAPEAETSPHALSCLLPTRGMPCTCDAEPAGDSDEADLPNGHAPLDALSPFMARRIAEPAGDSTPEPPHHTHRIDALYHSLCPVCVIDNILKGQS